MNNLGFGWKSIWVFNGEFHKTLVDKAELNWWGAFINDK